MAGASGRRKLVVDLSGATAYNDENNAQNNWGFNSFEGFMTVKITGPGGSTKAQSKSAPFQDGSMVWNEQLTLSVPEDAMELKFIFSRARPSRTSSSRRPRQDVISACGVYMQQLLQQLPLDKTFDLYRVGTGPAQPGGRVSVRMRVEPAGGQQEGAAGSVPARQAGSATSTTTAKPGRTRSGRLLPSVLEHPTKPATPATSESATSPAPLPAASPAAAAHEPYAGPPGLGGSQPRELSSEDSSTEFTFGDLLGSAAAGQDTPPVVTGAAAQQQAAGGRAAGADAAGGKGLVGKGRGGQVTAEIAAAEPLQEGRGRQEVEVAAAGRESGKLVARRGRRRGWLVKLMVLTVAAAGAGGFLNGFLTAYSEQERRHGRGAARRGRKRAEDPLTEYET